MYISIKKRFQAMATIQSMISELSSWKIEIGFLSLVVSFEVASKLSLLEILLSLLVLAAFRLVMLAEDLKWWSEAISKAAGKVEEKVTFAERRGMYNQLQGHEFVRQLRLWFYDYRPDASPLSWFTNKLFTEVNMFRQSLLLNGLELSLAVVI